MWWRRKILLGEQHANSASIRRLYSTPLCILFYGDLNRNYSRSHWLILFVLPAKLLVAVLSADFTWWVIVEVNQNQGYELLVHLTNLDCLCLIQYDLKFLPEFAPLMMMSDTQKVCLHFARLVGFGNLWRGIRGQQLLYSDCQVECVLMVSCMLDFSSSRLCTVLTRQQFSRTATWYFLISFVALALGCVPHWERSCLPWVSEERYRAFATNSDAWQRRIKWPSF